MTKKLQNNSQGASLLVTIMVILMRLVVGGVFVLSGFVKAIDPWGSYYKFNEYLMALGWESLMGLTVFGAFAIAVVEFVLGVMLVTGSCRRVAPLCATAFMLFMTPLTLWLAITDAVPDCGCFGDFIVLSNWATFGKNVALLAGAIYLVWLGRRVCPLYGPAVQWMVMMLSGAFSFLIAFCGYFTQPLLDFRPYKVGTHITSGATSTSSDDYVFVYEKDGETREFTINEIPDDDSDWQYVDRRTVKNKKSIAQSHDGVTFAAWDNGDDVSDSLLESEQLMLILIPNMEKVSIAYTFRINEFYDYANQHGVTVAGLTPASDDMIDEWNDIAMAHYPLYNAEDTEVKMIARGNPAIVYIRDGVIQWKRTLQSLDPDLIHNGEISMSQLSDDFKPDDIIEVLVWCYVLVMVVLLLLNRTHVMVELVFRGNKTANSKNDNKK